MPTVLVTRPEEDARAIADRLAEIGVDALIAPLFQVENIPGPPLDVETVQGFLVTSANGARALAARTARRDIPVYAVGDSTARAASGLGFESVTSAGGDVDDLARLVSETCAPGDGVLMHAAGSIVAGDLAEMLEPKGYKVWREMLYEAKAVERFPDAAQAALAAGRIDGVMLFSPRTARVFDVLAESAGLMDALRDVRLFALSENVTRASSAPWLETLIAPIPDRESLLDTVRTCYY